MIIWLAVFNVTSQALHKVCWLCVKLFQMQIKSHCFVFFSKFHNGYKKGFLLEVNKRNGKDESSEKKWPTKEGLKVSADPKLTVLHNFGFLYDSVNMRNSFRLKKIHKKCYSYGKLLSKNNSAILIILICRWQLLSSHCQIRRGHVTANHMSVFVFHKTHANKVVILWNLWMSSKKKKRSCPKAKTKEREESI